MCGFHPFIPPHLHHENQPSLQPLSRGSPREAAPGLLIFSLIFPRHIPFSLTLAFALHSSLLHPRGSRVPTRSQEIKEPSPAARETLSPLPASSSVPGLSPGDLLDEDLCNLTGTDESRVPSIRKRKEPKVGTVLFISLSSQHLNTSFTLVGSAETVSHPHPKW